MRAIRAIYRYRGVTLSFVKRDLAARYKGSTFGMLWSIINPIIMLVLYTFVFSTILKVRVGVQEGTGSFAIYLFCGMLPWNAFAEPLGRSTGIVFEHTNLIKRMVFPVEILPLYIVISSVVYQLIGFTILFLVLLASGHRFSMLIAFLPALLLLQMAFTVGLAWIVAGATVFFRDIAQIIGMITTLWLFLTPIFYTASLVPEGWRPLLGLNPMYALVESYRSIILKGQLPDPHSLIYLFITAALVFVVGHRIFIRMQPAFADVI